MNISAESVAQALRMEQAQTQAAQAQATQTQAAKDQAFQQMLLGGRDPSTLTAAEKAELDRRTAEHNKTITNSPDGAPAALGFNYLTGLNGQLKDQYKLSDWNNVNADTGALDMFRKTAQREAGELSPYAKFQMDKLGLDKAANLDNVGKTSAQSLLSAQSQLAQSGGLSGAARERMALNTSRDAAMGKQGVLRNSQLDQLNLQSSDEQNRMAGLKDLQGMNNTQADISFKNQQMQNDNSKYNLTNLLSENTQKRQFDSKQYSDQMAAWGAGKTADAQRASAGGGGKK